LKVKRGLFIFQTKPNTLTVADHTPTLEELEEAIDEALEDSEFDFVCGLAGEETDPPETQVSSSLPSTMPSESPAACTATLPNEFTSMTIFHSKMVKISTRTKLISYKMQP
jgi:hypothetical protein